MISTRTLSRTSRGSRGRLDRGNILPMTLIMMVLGSLIVTALMAFAITILRNRPPLEERSDSLEAVRSAMRIAIVMQRDHGPDGCFESSTSTFRVNNRDVVITCESIAIEDDNGGRFGLIATSNNGEGNGAAPGNEAMRVGDVDTQKIILSSVFVNGGNLGGNNGGLTINEGEVIASSYSSATGTSIHRYTTLDPAVDIEVDPLTTCRSLFGPDVQETDIDFNNQADGPLKAPDANTEIVGVMYSKGGAPDPPPQWTLDRSTTDTSTDLFDALPPLGLVADPDTDVGSTEDLRICYQQVPSTDLKYIPEWLTFCDSPIMAPEMFDQSAATATRGVECRNEPWWAYAGWKPNLRPDYIYPHLPQIPTYPRSSTPVPVGSTNCHVFYPGRYENAVTLDGVADDGGTKQYYFASGVYLFNKPLTITNGASVVMGEGSYRSCAFDADAAFLAGSPRNHEITGKGATLLLGSDGSGSSSLIDNGSIDVVDSSLRVNRRVATNATRASSGISVMSINLATGGPGPSDVEIPSDAEVLLPGCLASEVVGDPSTTADDRPECVESIRTYTLTPNGSGAYSTALTYEPSRLGPDAAIIHAELNGSEVTHNRVLFGGNLFVPNARIDMSTTETNDEYVVRLRNGAVASSFNFDFPTGDATNFLIGQETVTVYEKLKLAAVTTFDGKDFRSVAEVEVDTSNRYAINNWTVGSGSDDTISTTIAPSTTVTDGGTTTIAPDGGTTTVAGATTTTTTTTTTVPSGPTTSTATTIPATTTTTSTTTTTLSPNEPHNYCTSVGPSWTRDVGDGGYWAAEYRNVPTFNHHPNNPFDGEAEVTEKRNEVNFNNREGQIHPDIDKDFFTARFTRTVNFYAACEMHVAIGGDDGMRLYIDGEAILGDWTNHGFVWKSGKHQFSSGEHELVVEYYEHKNNSSLVFQWAK